MRILAISGSLNSRSLNTTLVRATAVLAPETMVFTIYEGLGDLPHFSPDRDGDDEPASVHELRRHLQEADGVLISTPEYAHGMPGSLKNALDWIVSSGEFEYKPTAAISASPSERGGDRAHAWLVQTLKVLGATIPEGATLNVPFVRAKLDADSVSDLATADALRSVLNALSQAIEKGR